MKTASKGIGMCKVCGKKQAYLNWADSPWDISHGTTVPMCHDCHRNKLVAIRDAVTKQLKEMDKR